MAIEPRASCCDSNSRRVCLATSASASDNSGLARLILLEVFLRNFVMNLAK